MTIKKCVSGCKGFENEICEKAPRCAYINSSTRKYCRLSSKYKMGKPPKCNITKRILKKHVKSDAVKKITRFLKDTTRREQQPLTPPLTQQVTQKSNKRKNPKDVIGRFMLKSRKNPQNKGPVTPPVTPPLTPPLTPKSNKKKNPKDVIGRFMLKTGEKRKALFLKSICSDSGVCIAFGQDSKKIIDFFDGFTNFNYVKLPITQIGNPSANGFVKQIEYEKSGYNAYSVLKSSVERDSDNLVYEYIVGQFINKANKFFPCFVETYGLYYYKNEVSWKTSKNTKVINTNILNDLLELQTTVYDYKKMCQQSKYAAILIQHLKNVRSLGDSLTSDFIIYDLLFVLYQIYMPLSLLRHTFTHYDLHIDNVLLFEPIKGKYIEYHYHLQNGDIVIFKSPYIVKIIDYGRSYFSPEHPDLNPTDIYNHLCSEPACSSNPLAIPPKCGSEFGFTFFNPSRKNEKYDWYINTNISNQSHDLKIFKYVSAKIASNKFKGIDPKWEKLLDPLVKLITGASQQYGKEFKGTEKFYGTKENLTSGLPSSKINNVKDAEDALRQLILNNVSIKQINNIKYKPEHKIGDIHVYTDGTLMKFVPV